jgi:hypothetical protein
MLSHNIILVLIKVFLLSTENLCYQLTYTVNVFRQQRNIKIDMLSKYVREFR